MSLVGQRGSLKHRLTLYHLRRRLDGCDCGWHSRWWRNAMKRAGL